MAYYDDYNSTDPRFGGGGEMVTTPSMGSGSWLPPGATINPDGSISLSNGSTLPAPPPGYTRDPNTGVVSYNGYDPNTGSVTGNPSQPLVPGLDPNNPDTANQPWKPEFANVTGTGGAPGGDGGIGGGGGSYGAGSGGSDFAFPSFNPPTYTPGQPFNGGQFKAPPAFSYGEFQAPTLAEAQNRPGYQFALDQGRKALENSAAARGVLRTGGTLKDLFSWGDKFGEQNYGAQFNQDLTGYTTNRENAADAYRLNYGISKDVFDTNYGSSRDAWDRANQSGLDTYDRLYRGSLDQFNPNYQTASLKFSDLYQRDRDKLNALTQLAGYGA